MGLLSFFSRKDSAGASPSGDAVEQARARARRRLIGAAVLVGLGVIGLPLLFETQPRPIAVDVPIEIPRKDAVAPLPPVPRVAASAPKRDEEVNAEPAAAADPVPSQAPPPPVAAKPAPPAKPDKPAAKLDKPATPVQTGLTAVQVGAYADAGAARQVQQRVEKLGLRTYTQVVDTEGGKRIRVRAGPFASREEAERAVGRIKSTGLPATVVNR